MKKLLMALLTLTSLSIFAASEKTCMDQLNKIIAGSKKKQETISRTHYLEAKEAFVHYRSLDGLGEEGTPVRFRKVVSYTKNHQRVGLKVIISDGGDESDVEYYLDSKLKLVFARWYNQSPVNFWFCGKKKPYIQE